MNEIIEKTSIRFSGNIAVHTKAQAETFALASRCRIVRNGIDLKDYQYFEKLDNYLVWVARISPKKRLEDAVESVFISNEPKDIANKPPIKYEKY